MEFLRARRPSLSIDMAPLIDVVFQLLIFFMLSSSFAAPSIRMRLPEAATRDPKTPEALVVSVERDGTLTLNVRRTSFEALQGDLRKQLAAQKTKTVQVRGDREMPYKYFVQVMDQARQAGARQVSIEHDPGASKT